MNASRAALVVVGLNLVGVWAAAAAGSRTAPIEPAAAPRMAAELAVEEARSSLQAATLRLESRARPAAASTLTRDPFRFAADVGPPRHREAGRPLPTAPAPSEASPAANASPSSIEPDIVLQGMAESGEGDGVVRTAILRVGSELVLASIGTRLEGRYEVVALTADTAEMEDIVEHVRRTFRMK